MTILVYEQAEVQPRSLDAVPVMFLAFHKIKDAGQVTAAIRHNKRRGEPHWRRAECIDASRSHLNYVLHGPTMPRDAQKLVDLALGTVRRKIRDGTILVIEVVVSLPVGSPTDHRAYFAAALPWIATDFAGGAVVVSADVHLDEATPHMHVLVVPVIEGRVCGHSLLDGPDKLRSWLDGFHAKVASKFGLSRHRCSKTRARAPDCNILCVGAAGSRDSDATSPNVRAGDASKAPRGGESFAAALA